MHYPRALAVVGGLLLAATLLTDTHAQAPKLLKRGPVTCRGNDTASAKNVIIETTGDALVAQGNCDINIRDSVIKAARGAVQRGNGTIRLTNTTIEATDTGILVMAPGDIDVTGGSITSESDGARDESSGSIHLTNTTVTGNPLAVINKGSGSIILKDTKRNGGKRNEASGEIVE